MLAPPLTTAAAINTSQLLNPSAKASDSDFILFCSLLHFMITISRLEKMESASCLDPIGNSDKVCVDCQTSKTPLWRSGPAGPKSLCNACGIRYRKRSVTGSDKKKVKHLPSQSQTSSSSSTNSCSTMSYRNREMDEMKKSELRIEAVAVAKEAVLLRRRRSAMKKVKREMVYRKIGEVEEAACLLMSLSCGLGFA